MQFGVISACKFFKDYKLHSPYGLAQVTRAYLHEIVLEIVVLPINNLRENQDRRDFDCAHFMNFIQLIC